MFPFSYYLLIPSHLDPLRAIPLISSYLGSTWESLGPQVTSSVSFVPSLSPSPLYSHGSLGGCQLTRFSSPTRCCVPCLLPTTRKPCPSPILFPSAFAKTPRRSLSSSETVSQSSSAGISLTLTTCVVLSHGTSTLAVTIDICPSGMSSPRYSMRVCWKVHFSGFRYRS